VRKISSQRRVIDYHSNRLNGVLGAGGTSARRRPRLSGKRPTTQGRFVLLEFTAIASPIGPWPREPAVWQTAAVQRASKGEIFKEALTYSSGSERNSDCGGNIIADGTEVRLAGSSMKTGTSKKQLLLGALLLAYPAGRALDEKGQRRPHRPSRGRKGTRCRITAARAAVSWLETCAGSLDIVALKVLHFKSHLRGAESEGDPRP